MDQSKKRDHKIMVTDIAIEKIPYIKINGLSDEICEAIQNEHKEILRLSKTLNKSNEVLTLMSVTNLEIVRVLGDEFKVDPSSNPVAVTLFRNTGRNELMYLHNHPSTNKFSWADIAEFIYNGNIGLLSVVTNQGEVYILYKTPHYNFAFLKDFLTEVYEKIKFNLISHNEAVKKFLKECHKGGVLYAKSD